MNKYKSIARILTHDEYLSLPSLGSSSIKAHAHHPYAIDKVRVETAAMRFGTAVHKLILEPNSFEEEYYVSEFNDRRYKLVKEQIETYQDIGIKWLSSDEGKQLSLIKKAIENTKYAKAMLSPEGYAETSFEFEIDDIKCKCRPDWVTKIGDTYFCADIKTISTKSGALSTRDIERYIADYGCHIQAAFYRMGLRKVLDTDKVIFSHIFIQVPTKGYLSSQCIASVMPDESFDVGESEINNAISNIKKYKITPTAEEFISEKQLDEDITKTKGIPLIGLPHWYKW